MQRSFTLYEETFSIRGCLYFHQRLPLLQEAPSSIARSTLCHKVNALEAAASSIQAVLGECSWAHVSVSEFVGQSMVCLLK